uniref:Large ribosomal subunit protein uL23c n=1 Tax=Euglena clara TaxID=215708 RepID=A0A2Z4YZ35_9EUGL|nr:ribosomal protein L23 [Euglena clara]AXA45483.1 ribosomal protein L23 [Euglena clara]
MNKIDLIKSQVLTEKTNKLLQKSVYVFNVDKKFTKNEFKILLEEIFSVKVLSINSCILPIKNRRLGKFQGSKNSYKRIFAKISNEKVLPFFSSI